MAQVNGVFQDNLQTNVRDSKVLMVGAGGIGCELLKNLVLSGFQNITIIDLDTIDVSNLNRQFLFQKQHVGKSKSACAKEAALRFAPECAIESLHGSIMKDEYNRDWFKQFNIVLNALDNRQARNHVNRMCLAADVPLVESGTAGYLGQVTVIKKNKYECYECNPKPTQKTFPGCTIRNTPSEPIHCIVWAKHLFNQLFGEDDPDQDVSPDTEDPEAAGEAAGENGSKEDAAGKDGNVKRKSTRMWAEENDYNTQKLFQKLFCDDIKYLLSMENLWKNRKDRQPPSPQEWDCLSSTPNVTQSGDVSLADQKVWSVAECATQLDTAITALKQLKTERGDLEWDKDDLPALNFVTACANIRMFIFNIKQKSRFEVKSMAGNIIPAIATTNAVIAGCIVMEALKILSDQIDNCKTVYLRTQPNARGKILVTERLEPPNPKCIVCRDDPEANVKLNMNTFTLKMFEEKILKGSLNMVAPDAEVAGKGTILITSDSEERDEAMLEKPLSDFVADGAVLSCDDFLQNYNLRVYLWHADTLEDGKEFLVAGDKEKLQPKAEEEPKEAEKPKEEDTNGKSSDMAIDVDDDIIEISNTENGAANGSGDKKRPHEEENGNHAKKQKLDDAEDVLITEEKSAEQVSAEELKKRKAAEETDDGVVCLE